MLEALGAWAPTQFSAQAFYLLNFSTSAPVVYHNGQVLAKKQTQFIEILIQQLSLGSKYYIITNIQADFYHVRINKLD